MAFTLQSPWTTAKYRHSFTGDEGTSYVLEIHEDGFASTTATVEIIGRSAIETRWSHDGSHEYAPLLTSETVVALYDDGEAIVSDLESALDTVDNKYILLIRSGDDIKWIGRIDPESLRFEEDGPVKMTLTATDGLGRLEAKPYITNTDGTAVDSGAATFVAIIADVLASTGFGLDFYVSSSMYHKTSPTLGATANPLENTWANKLAFTGRSGDDSQAMMSKLAVLTEVCKAWGMKCFQANGAWHLIQANHLAANSYRRWRYDSAGSGKVTDSNSPNDYEDIDPRQTISAETYKRSISTAEILPGYNSSLVQYQHGPVQMIRYPRFEPQTISEAEAAFGAGGTYPWSQSVGNAQLYVLDDGTWGMGIYSVDADASAQTGYAEIPVNDVTPKIANAGNGGGGWTTLIGNKKSSQTSQSFQLGSTFGITFQVYGKSYSSNPPSDPYQYADTHLALQVYHNGQNQYLQFGSDGSLDWTATNTWLLLKNQLGINAWHNVALKDVEATTADGTITITLGPVISDETAQGIWERAVWDNVQLFPILDDGTVNADATSVLNFIDRSEPRPVQLAVMLGDGPTKYNKSSMFSNSTLAGITADWEETITGHSGTDTNVSHTQLLGEMMLTSMNKVRRKHQAAYMDFGRVLTPLDVLSRNSALWPAWEIRAVWQQEYSEGAWYKADENIFINDLETGVSTGAHLLSATPAGVSGDSGFNYNRIGSSFDTLLARESDRLATVSADNDGSGGSPANVTVSCTALAYDLKAGDHIFFQSKKTGYIMKREVAADAAASATSFTVTVPFSASEPINDGDPILPGSIAGLRIDFDGISVLNTHIKSEGTYGWNGVVDSTGTITTPGTLGWIISKSGEAEFSNLTVRGTLSTLEGTLAVNGGAFSRSTTGGTIKIDNDGLLLEYDRADSVDVPNPCVITWDNENGTDTVFAGFSASDKGGGVWSTDDWRVSSVVPIAIVTTAGNADITLTPHGTGQIVLDYATFPASDGTSGQVLQTNGSGTLSWAPASGATTFPGLTDTPANYTSAANYFVRVNSTPDALEFVAAGSINLSSFNNDLSFGDASGPASSTNSAVALFDGTTGKLLKNSSLTVSGGTITAGGWQGTAIAVSYGGTGATDAATARSNLGLAIGTNVQAYNSGLASIAALVDPNADRLLYWNDGANNYGYLSLNVSNFTNDANYVASGANISVFTNDAGYLTSGVTGPGSSVDNRVVRFNGITGDVIQSSVVTIDDTGIITGAVWNGGAIPVAYGGTGATTAADARTNLGLVIGTNVQAYDADLSSIAGLVDPNADRLLGWVDGAGNYGYYSAGSGISIGSNSVSVDISPLTTGTAGDWSIGYTMFETSGGAINKIQVGGVLASLASLSDPGADRILIWDDSVGAVKFMSLGAGLSTNSTPTLLTSVRVDSSEMQTDAITLDPTSRSASTFMPIRIAGSLYYVQLYT